MYVFFNRYQFAQQTGYTANEKVTTLCKDLDITVHKVSVFLQCFKGDSTQKWSLHCFRVALFHKMEVNGAVTVKFQNYNNAVTLCE